MPWRDTAERARRRGLGCALLLCGGGVQPTGADTLALVQRAAQEGEFARALEIVRAESDPLSALRAQVWLDFRARDFAGAQRSVQAALALAPEELWLAERAVACALWQRDAQLAQHHLAGFESVFDRAPESRRGDFRAALADAQVQAALLVSGEQRAQAALARARAVALGLLTLAVATLAWLALGMHRNRKRKAGLDSGTRLGPT